MASLSVSCADRYGLTTDRNEDDLLANAGSELG